MGREPGLRRKGFDHAGAQASRFVEPAEQQTGATQRVVGPVVLADDSPRGLALEELLAFPKPIQGLARLTELREDPGRGSDRGRKREDDVPRSVQHDSVFYQRAGFGPVTFKKAEYAGSMVGSTNGERMMRRLGEPDRLGLILGRLGESAELGEAHDQPEAVVDRGWSAASEVLVDSIGGQRREVFGGKLDHPFVLAPEVLHLLETSRGEDAKLQVPPVPCD